MMAACAPNTPAQHVPVGDAMRGRLLYDTNCGACHTTQRNWREKRLVKSWPQLLEQVDRWQKVAGQNWTSTDITDVAAYLNQQYYLLPAPEKS